MGGSKTISNETPKVNNLQVTTSAYGLVVPIIFGRTRVSGNVLDYMDFTAHACTETQSAGGKGGGETKQETTTYTYSVVVVLSICEGPVHSIPTVWADKSKRSLGDLGLAYYCNQRYGYLVSRDINHALYYRNTAYVAGNLYLDDQTSLPNMTFEVHTNFCFPGKDDANPADIVRELLTNPYYGAGLSSDRLAGLTQYSNYCVANGIFQSLALTEQKGANEWITDICRMTNSQPVWSEGRLKFIPYGDETIAGNGVTFVPEVTPIYDLDANAFIASGDEPPVICYRDSATDAFNTQPLEYLNREADYNVTMEEAQDLTHIRLNGLRPADPIQAHGICDRGVAQKVSQLILNRKLYNRNRYSFKAGWKFYLLEPMDIITITEPGLGLDKQEVRILSIQEEEGQLSFEVEEFQTGVHRATLYPLPEQESVNIDTNVSPGSVNEPVIFEPPDALTNTGFEVWMGISGQAKEWGGCDIWVSEDGDSYKRISRVSGNCRQGVLTDQLPAGDNSLDLLHAISVDLSACRGKLMSGTQQDAHQLHTLCWVDGELIAYQSATLTGPNRYNLTYLVRGNHGTEKKAHQAGSKLLRLDDALFEYPFNAGMIGKTLYLKFVSFNYFGGGMQSLGEVEEYQYTITGEALKSPMPVIKDLTMVLQGDVPWLTWAPIQDFREFVYEIRKGAVWATAQVIGKTNETKFQCVGDGTYWVSAKSAQAYSELPASIVVTSTSKLGNVLASFDEYKTGWQGAVSNAACKADGIITLAGAGMFDEIPDLDNLADLDFYGDIQAVGEYTIPETHIIDIEVAGNCNVVAQITVSAEVAPDYAAEKDPNEFVAGRIQIRKALTDGVFGDWEDFSPGTHLGRLFDFRIILESKHPKVRPVLSSFTYSVDVPDRFDEGSKCKIPVGGTEIYFNTLFHRPPNVLLTILDAEPGDTPIMPSYRIACDKFYIKVKNGGQDVERQINYMARGF